MSRYDEYDHDAWDRPGRSSRPRTKRRPDFSDTVPGVVVAVDRGRLRCELDNGVAVTAVKARQLGRKGVVVGDRVAITGDTSGTPDTLARILEVAPRTTELRRSADDFDVVERVIVANAEQLVIVTALADPPPRRGMIDRALVAAHHAGIAPLLCLTKADLASAEDLVADYERLGVPSVVTSRGGDLDPLRERLAERTSVLLGHSGVGKSTLMNALIPDADRSTGSVNETTGRGRHTSTNAVMMRLPGGGWVIDTPGIRSFGLAHLEVSDIVAAFGDLADVLARCPRGCTHAEGEPGCALDEVDPADAERAASLRRILAGRDD